MWIIIKNSKYDDQNGYSQCQKLLLQNNLLNNLMFRNLHLSGWHKMTWDISYICFLLIKKQVSKSHCCIATIVTDVSSAF